MFLKTVVIKIHYTGNTALGIFCIGFVALCFGEDGDGFIGACFCHF